LGQAARKAGKLLMRAANSRGSLLSIQAASLRWPMR